MPVALITGGGRRLGRQITYTLAEAGFETWGIEPSRSFRELALQQYSIDPERLHQVSIEDASFPENSLSHVFAIIACKAIKESGLAVLALIERICP